MPLLPLESFIYPADLLSTPRLGLEETSSWWVLHSRPRAEKTLARKLLEFRQDFFLPLYKKQWRNSGRSLTSYVPLFPGYVFLWGNEAARLKALQTKQVVRALPVPDGNQLWSDLARIHRLMECGAPVAPEDRLQPGMPALLTAGPLAGLQGKIVRRDKHMRFIIEVDFIQRGASIEVEGWMLQPLGDRQTHAAGV